MANEASDLAYLATVTPDEAVALEVLNERDRQDAKWGEQNHPDGTGEWSRPLQLIAYGYTDATLNTPFEGNEDAGSLARIAKAITDSQAGYGLVTWRDILLEEVFEALAESDEEKLERELIQTAAVAQQWVSAIRRRRAARA